MTDARLAASNLRGIRGIGLAVLLVSVAANARAQSYTAIDLGSTLPGGSVTYAFGINNSGQVVGTATIAGGHPHAFRYSDGILTDLGAPSGSYSYGRGINNAGQVVGMTMSLGASVFVYSGGMPFNGETHPWIVDAYGINDSGQVVASSYDIYGTSIGLYLYSDWSKIFQSPPDRSLIPDLSGYFPGLNSPPPAGLGGFCLPHINNRGQILGSSPYGVGYYHAALYSGGSDRPRKSKWAR